MYLNPNFSTFDKSNGSLVFEFPHGAEKVRISSWESGCQLETEKDDCWLSLMQDADMTLFGNDFLRSARKEAQEAIDSYCHSIPLPVSRGLAAYRENQLAMLQVCAASERGIQLLDYAPTLLWLVAPTLLRINRAKGDDIHELLGLRQKELLRLVCGKEDAWLPGFFQRIGFLEKRTDFRRLREDLMLLLTSSHDISALQYPKEFSPELISHLSWRGQFLNTPIDKSILASELSHSEMTELIDRLPYVFNKVLLSGEISDASEEEISDAWHHWEHLFQIYHRWLAKRLIDATPDEQESGFPDVLLHEYDFLDALLNSREKYYG